MLYVETKSSFLWQIGLNASFLIVYQFACWHFLNSLSMAVNFKLTATVDWFNANKLSLNIIENQFCSFRSYRKV